MTIQNPRLWIASLSAGGVLFLVLGEVSREAPGSLAAVHERESELSGSRDCAECHGRWGQSMASACLDCHEDIETHVDEGEGLHGTLGPEVVSACALCHSEHHGSGFSIINRQSFAVAGVLDPDQFDHEMIGWVMDGEHLELDCTECHEHAKDTLLPEGARRFIDLDEDCSTCHEDAHEGQMVLACAGCHGQTAFDQLRSPSHDEFLPLVGGHGDVDCQECHQDGAPSSFDVLGRGMRTLPPRECLDCHESPHQIRFVDAVAQFVELPLAASCVECHEAEHVSFREEGLEITTEQHALTGFPLEVPHDEVSCEDCHSTETEDFTLRYPGRPADECRHCHEDPHEGQFQFGVFADVGCVGCHDRVQFEPHAFTFEQHQLSSFHLTGTHVETECNECHAVPSEGAPRVFHATPSNCEQCHEDAHRGFFEESSPGLLICASCHLTTAFSEVPADGFDHERWANFPILGAHDQAECEVCHPRSEEPDELGRSFGWVSEHFAPFEGCNTCHTDLHDGDFDTPDLPQEVDGRTDCARCHDEASWRNFPGGFAHGMWTGFAVQGVHAEVGCTGCHAPLAAPDELGRTWGRALGSECSACHANPHAGQFRVDGRTDCTRCHRSARSFSFLTFDHERDSRFSLGDAHSALPCSDCHVPWPINENLEVVRYRPLGTECSDCHGDGGGRRNQEGNR